MTSGWGRADGAGDRWASASRDGSLDAGGGWGRMVVCRVRSGVCGRASRLASRCLASLPLASFRPPARYAGPGRLSGVREEAEGSRQSPRQGAEVPELRGPRAGSSGRRRVGGGGFVSPGSQKDSSPRAGRRDRRRGHRRVHRRLGSLPSRGSGDGGLPPVRRRRAGRRRGRVPRGLPPVRGGPADRREGGHAAPQDNASKIAAPTPASSTRPLRATLGPSSRRTRMSPSGWGSSR